MNSRIVFAIVAAVVVAAPPPSDAATFLFIRHAQSTTNSGEAATPEEVLDPPLTALGEQQALDLVGRLAGFDLTTIYVSDFQRTALTIAPTAADRGLTPIVEPAIREWSFGDGTQPLDVNAIVALFGTWLGGDTDARLPGVPDSESLDDLVARVVPAYEEIFDRHKAEDGVVAIVGHGGSIGWVMPSFVDNVSLAFALSNNLPNTGVIEVVADRAGRPQVADWNGIPFTVDQPAVIPLPATVFLLIGGLGGLAALRGRARATS